MNPILENLEENVGSVLKLADLTKAFDTVDHKILPEKCELHGLRGKIISLLRGQTLKNVKSTLVITIQYQTFKQSTMVYQK